MERDPQELMDELEANRSGSLAELRKENAVRQLQIAELKRLVSAEGIKEDTLKLLAENVALLTPPPAPPYPGPPGRKRVTWVLLVSDLQHGQLTTRNASGGVFEQTGEVSRIQMGVLWNRLQEAYLRASATIEVERLALFFLGDMLEGDSMRASQAMKVDRPVMVQSLEVTDMQTVLVHNCLSLFPRVDVYSVGGNHDRNSPKPGTAGLGELSMVNTFAWLGAEILRRLFGAAIEQGRMTLSNSESWFGAARVAGLKTVYEHGASFKASTGSYGGISYYSLVNAAQGYVRMLDGADLVLFAHFHQPMVLPMKGGWAWQVVNGAFPPSSEFIQSQFKGLVRPTQWLLELTEGEGVTGWTPLYVDAPGQVVRPGAYWETR